MKTRSQRNLKNVNISDLLLESKKTPTLENKPKFTILKPILIKNEIVQNFTTEDQGVDSLPVTEILNVLNNFDCKDDDEDDDLELYPTPIFMIPDIINDNSQSIIDSRTITVPLQKVEQKQYDVTRNDSSPDSLIVIQTDLPQADFEYNICVFDTETFTDQKLPIQIAWNIYKIHEKHRTMKLITQKMYYVTEMWVMSQMRDDLSNNIYFTEKTMLRHEDHLKSMDYPLKPAKYILNEFENDLINCKYVSAFNIEWDIIAINNLISKFNINVDDNSHSVILFKNPILNYDQLDIMNMVFDSFGTKLIKSGIKENIINESGRKVNKSYGGICTAEYMARIILKDPFGQKHLADEDVKLESKLILKCLEKKGTILYEKTQDPIYISIQKLTKTLYPKLNGVDLQQKVCLSCNDLIEIHRHCKSSDYCNFCYDTQSVILAEQ